MYTLHDGPGQAALPSGRVQGGGALTTSDDSIRSVTLKAANMNNAVTVKITTKN